MYFKINTPQKDKYTDMGMVNISASFYLEKGDEGYDKYMAEHYVQVPVIPEGGYQGKINEIGEPADLKDYQAWYANLERVWQLNPFCNHSIQFEAEATEEEILWCFEYALAITARNYLIDDLHCKNGGQVVNQGIGYLARRNIYKVLSLMPCELKQTDEDAIKWSTKITNAETKVMALSEVDFAQIKTIAKYRVK
jgi:hypothetical protein